MVALVKREWSKSLTFRVERINLRNVPDPGPRVTVSIFNSRPLTNDEAVELAAAILEATDRGLSVCCAGCASFCDHPDGAE